MPLPSCLACITLKQCLGFAGNHALLLPLPLTLPARWASWRRRWRRRSARCRRARCCAASCTTPSRWGGAGSGAEQAAAVPLVCALCASRLRGDMHGGSMREGEYMHETQRASSSLLPAKHAEQLAGCAPLRPLGRSSRATSACSAACARPPPARLWRRRPASLCSPSPPQVLTGSLAVHAALRRRPEDFLGHTCSLFGLFCAQHGGAQAVCRLPFLETPLHPLAEQATSRGAGWSCQRQSTAATSSSTPLPLTRSLGPPPPRCGWVGGRVGNKGGLLQLIL